MLPTLTQPRTAFRISLFLGLIIVALSIASFLQQPPTACGGLKPTFTPIIAFELARSEADLYALFGSEANECRAVMIEQMDAVNRIDVAVFIPHQANKRIIMSAADRLGMPEEKVILNIAEYGNTTAGTIPLAMQTARDQGNILWDWQPQPAGDQHAENADVPSRADEVPQK